MENVHILIKSSACKYQSTGTLEKYWKSWYCASLVTNKCNRVIKV